MFEENQNDNKSIPLKEFTLEFEKKLAKFIPPKIEFKTNLNNLSIVKEFEYKDAFISSLQFFFGYLIVNVNNSIYFYDKSYNLTFKYEIFKNEEENNGILKVKTFEEDILIIAANKTVRIVKFFEKEPKKITYEIIQEIFDTEYYYLNEILSNNYLILSNFHKKYVFYQLENKNEKFSSNNKFKAIGSIENVHNVYNDVFPGIIDLNNGRLFSWMKEDSNIKIIEYEPKIRIIISKNNYDLNNAGLISDKYICLMGFETWLMETENFEIVKTFENFGEFFYGAICECKFFSCSEYYLKIETIKFENGNLVKEKLSEKEFSDYYNDFFNEVLVINENSFIANNLSGKLFILKAE